MPRVSIVVNPISGSARRAADLETFRRRLESAGHEVLDRPTRAAGHAVELAEQDARDGVDVVVAAGGDGTLNEVARGVLAAGETTTRVAILPRGTSNLVARDLGVPLNARGAADVVLGGVDTAMDVADVNGRLSIACVGVGWDAYVVQELSAARKGHIRFHTYLKPMWRAARAYAFEPLRVTVDDSSPLDASLVLILNTRPYAAFFRPAPDARCDDGLLDVLLLRGGRAQLPAWIWGAWRGTLADSRHATLLRGRHVRVEADQPVPFQIDGDVGAHTPVDVRVRPGVLRILRP